MSKIGADVLRDARQTLTTARWGLRDVGGPDPARRRAGLRNVAVWGRAVTNVLQNLRSVDRPGFDAWYAPFAAEMRADALLRYFYVLRSTVLKEGGPRTSANVYIEHLDTRDLAALMADPPAGANGFFIGDHTGGSGWEVQLPDGSVEKVYVQLPEAVRMSWVMTLPDAPGEHLGIPIQDRSAENLCRLYLAYLEELLTKAQRRFTD